MEKKVIDKMKLRCSKLHCTERSYTPIKPKSQKLITNFLITVQPSINEESCHRNVPCRKAVWGEGNEGGTFDQVAVPFPAV